MSTQQREAVRSEALSSIGPLAFSEEGTLFVSDPLAAAIVAYQLDAQGSGGARGTGTVDAINVRIGELLKVPSRDVRITDIVVHPLPRTVDNRVLTIPAGVLG